MTQILKPTEAMIEAGTAELARWLNRDPSDIDDLVPASVYLVMEAARHPDPDELREALEAARAAIASLDADALGMSQPMLCDPRQPPWPIRDELLAKIDTALSRNQGDAG